MYLQTSKKSTNLCKDRSSLRLPHLCAFAISRLTLLHTTKIVVENCSRDKSLQTSKNVLALWVELGQFERAETKSEEAQVELLHAVQS